MDKIKTSVRRKGFAKSIQRKIPTRKIKPGMGVKPYNPTEALLNEEKIGRAIWECLKNGDYEGVLEVIQIHLDARKRSRQAKEEYLPKETSYQGLKSKNPTIKTLAKLVSECV